MVSIGSSELQQYGSDDDIVIMMMMIMRRRRDKISQISSINMIVDGFDMHYISNDLQFRLDTKGSLVVGIYTSARRLKSLLHADVGVFEVVLSHCCCCDTTIDTIIVKL